jgi:hypothetical protein
MLCYDVLCCAAYTDTYTAMYAAAAMPLLQVNAELSAFVSRRYGLPPQAFSLAVCGLRALSEHEDECCVTLQLHAEEIPAALGAPGAAFNPSPAPTRQGGETGEPLAPAALAAAVAAALEASFLRAACLPAAGLSKGSKVNKGDRTVLNPLV